MNGFKRGMGGFPAGPPQRPTYSGFTNGAVTGYRSRFPSFTPHFGATSFGGFSPRHHSAQQRGHVEAEGVHWQRPAANYHGHSKTLGKSATEAANAYDHRRVTSYKSKPSYSAESVGMRGGYKYQSVPADGKGRAESIGKPNSQGYNREWNAQVNKLMATPEAALFKASALVLSNAERALADFESGHGEPQSEICKALVEEFAPKDGQKGQESDLGIRALVYHELQEKLQAAKMLHKSNTDQLNDFCKRSHSEFSLIVSHPAVVVSPSIEHELMHDFHQPSDLLLHIDNVAEEAEHLGRHGESAQPLHDHSDAVHLDPDRTFMFVQDKAIHFGNQGHLYGSLDNHPPPPVLHPDFHHDNHVAAQVVHHNYHAPAQVAHHDHHHVPAQVVHHDYHVPAQVMHHDYHHAPAQVVHHEYHHAPAQVVHHEYHHAAESVAHHLYP